ncbi:MAG: hypothetical protein NT006_12720 [Candidatus Aminicenantes bacterium]|nr:hypothetical protein [Candidatus Aminicenantes bacterium]
MLSYKAKSFEPYIVGRFNYVQFTLGSIFWLTKTIGLNVEGSAFAGKPGLEDYGDFAVPSFVFLGGVKRRF